MKLQLQVTSLSLSKKLKELGVKQNSSIYWVKDPKSKKYWLNPDYCEHIGWGLKMEGAISAFTVAELGELLSGNSEYMSFPEKNGNGHWYVTIDGMERYGAKTEANSRALMLIHLISNKLMTL